MLLALNLPEPLPTIFRVILFFILAPAIVASAQENPMSEHSRFTYGYVKTILISSAEKMPEGNYSYKPAEVVRSYGQIIGHVADAQYLMCSAAIGEKNPALNIEKTKTSKADLVAALKAALAYCDRAYDGMNDATGAQLVKFGGRQTPRLGVLYVNHIHTIEHYGNLVTYMRMNNVIPPTSEPGFGQQPKK